MSPLMGRLLVEIPALADWRLNLVYNPAMAAGGDFYDFVPLTNGRLGMAPIDRAGPGVPE